MRRHRLSSQVVLSMTAVATVAALIVFVGSFIFYAIYLSYFPPPPGPPPIFPTGPDFIVIAVLLFFGLIVAIIVALRLARRILAPLNSLALGARKIAAGDLTARALPGDRSLGETAQLVDDFNAMAQKLEDFAEAMISWNVAIAHELRTPLTILRGRLQGLTDGVFKPSDELFRNLLFQVEGLTRLVEDLRVVTLSDSQKLEMRFEPTQLGGQIEQMVDAMRPELLKAGFQVEVVTLPLVMSCDGVRLRQALLALLENARRYATPGLLKVLMRREGEEIVLAVEDQGPGLSPDFATCAFEAFSRAEASRSRKSGGSGLGLSVVRAIAEAHHGQARYGRSADGGSVFEIIVPMATQQALAHDISASHDRKAPEERGV